MLKENLASVANIPTSELNVTTILRRYEYDQPSSLKCDFCKEKENHFHSRITVTKHSPGSANSEVQIDHEELVVGNGSPEFAIHQGLRDAFLKINRRIGLRMENNLPVVAWKSPGE